MTWRARLWQRNKLEQDLGLDCFEYDRHTLPTVVIKGATPQELGSRTGQDFGNR